MSDNRTAIRNLRLIIGKLRKGQAINPESKEEEMLEFCLSVLEAEQPQVCRDEPTQQESEG